MNHRHAMLLLEAMLQSRDEGLDRTAAASACKDGDCGKTARMRSMRDGVRHAAWLLRKMRLLADMFCDIMPQAVGARATYTIFCPACRKTHDTATPVTLDYAGFPLHTTFVSPQDLADANKILVLLQSNDETWESWLRELGAAGGITPEMRHALTLQAHDHLCPACMNQTTTPTK